MTVRAIVVVLLLAAIIGPIVAAEIGRRGTRRVRVRKSPPPPVAQPVATKPLQLVVDKSEMDRELAALLARSRKSTDE